jgi:hypothetical protein
MREAIAACSIEAQRDYYEELAYELEVELSESNAKVDRLRAEKNACLDGNEYYGTRRNDAFNLANALSKSEAEDSSVIQTDTPRTNACPHCGAKYFNVVEWECGTTPIIDGDTHRSPFCIEREACQKAKVEVERLKELVIESARKGDELLEPYRLRAEKAETLIKQIHAFVEALKPSDK